MTSADHASGGGTDLSGHGRPRGRPQDGRPPALLAPFGFLVGLASHRSARTQDRHALYCIGSAPGASLQAARHGRGRPPAAEADKAGRVSLAGPYQAPYGSRTDSEVHGLHF